ncbi:uncharacterized protein VTP21DRAFT_2333 [Calcarisporiella thermophila]|uniref:uncharacterized protein n=1 Tax=Calcarisporiella thermophila TaxID=911321 RepID=UPI0037420BAA
MFRSTPPNPFDERVRKATAENAPENWQLILDVCDGVQNAEDAEKCASAVMKRLKHRNCAVQLLTLTVIEALVKNGSPEIRREVASRPFVKSMTTLLREKNTDVKVKEKILDLIQQWAIDFYSDPYLYVIQEKYEKLKTQGFRFPIRPIPNIMSNQAHLAKKEEEELQLALALSLSENQYDTFPQKIEQAQYHLPGKRIDSLNSNSIAGKATPSNLPSTTSQAKPPLFPKTSTKPATSGPSPFPTKTQNLPKPSSSSPTSGTSISAPVGSMSRPGPATCTKKPASGPQLYANSLDERVTESKRSKSTEPIITASNSATETSLSSKKPSNAQPVVRVRALFDYEPTNTDEDQLTFKKDDVILLIEKKYKEWWYGVLNRKQGLFPVNYVKIIENQSDEEMRKEAERESRVLREIHVVNDFVEMMKGIDLNPDKFSNDEALQTLFRRALASNSEISKEVDIYERKQDELLWLNERLSYIISLYDRVMEASIAKYSHSSSSSTTLHRRHSAIEKPVDFYPPQGYESIHSPPQPQHIAFPTPVLPPATPMIPSTPLMIPSTPTPSLAHGSFPTVATGYNFSSNSYYPSFPQPHHHTPSASPSPPSIHTNTSQATAPINYVAEGYPPNGPVSSIPPTVAVSSAPYPPSSPVFASPGTSFMPPAQPSETAETHSVLAHEALKPDTDEIELYTSSTEVLKPDEPDLEATVEKPHSFPEDYSPTPSPNQVVPESEEAPGPVYSSSLPTPSPTPQLANDDSSPSHPQSTKPASLPQTSKPKTPLPSNESCSPSPSCETQPQASSESKDQAQNLSSNASAIPPKPTRPLPTLQPIQAQTFQQQLQAALAKRGVKH